MFDIILDEVHKVAADTVSSAADVTRVFREWLRMAVCRPDRILGHTDGIEPQLHSLGLELAYVMPTSELIGQGWVAPFAEFGAPFNYSEREREAALRIDEYKALVRAYLRRIGAEKSRGWFAAIPLVERLRIAARRRVCRPAGRRYLIQARMTVGETGGDLGLGEAMLVGIDSSCVRLVG